MKKIEKLKLKATKISEESKAINKTLLAEIRRLKASTNRENRKRRNRVAYILGHAVLDKNEVTSAMLRDLHPQHRDIVQQYLDTLSPVVKRKSAPSTETATGTQEGQAAVEQNIKSSKSLWSSFKGS